jgi:hypothetical protein
MQYNYKIAVEYKNNKEYRECFRKTFGLDSEQILNNLRSKYADFESFEDETKDELMFDEPKVNEIMGEILDKTLYIDEFRELYLKTAGLVISNIPDIGLAVLLAYDYYYEFHAVLAEYFTLLEKYNWVPENIDGSTELENFFKNSEAFYILTMKLGNSKRSDQHNEKDDTVEK